MGYELHTKYLPDDLVKCLKRSVDHATIRLIVTIAIALCAGCQTGGQQIAGDRRADTPVKLSPGDVIKVTFTGAPELSQSQKIRTDGKVNLPLVGEVSAANKTIDQLQKDLVSLYKPQLKNSDVLVTLESGVGQVVVSGAVARPGKIEFDRPTTVFQAIMQAGGASQYGSLKKVRLVRTSPNGEQQSQVLNLTGTLKGRPSEAVYVKDGDVIYVSETAF